MTPPIICLCGSTRFRPLFDQANKHLTLQGYIVLSVGFFGHLEVHPLDPSAKQSLDSLHLNKIDLADEVLFINPDNYFGDSTTKELQYAFSLASKLIRFLEPVPPDSLLSLLNIPHTIPSPSP